MQLGVTLVSYFPWIFPFLMWPAIFISITLKCTICIQWKTNAEHIWEVFVRFILARLSMRPSKQIASAIATVHVLAGHERLRWPLPSGSGQFSKSMQVVEVSNIVGRICLAFISKDRGMRNRRLGICNLEASRKTTGGRNLEFHRKRRREKH